MTIPTISKGSKSFEMIWMARITPRVWMLALYISIIASFSFILGFLGFGASPLALGCCFGGRI